MLAFFFMIKPLITYTIVYIAITFVMSYDEIECAFQGEQLCWINIIGKYFIFLFLMIIFNKLFKPLISRKR